MNDLVAVMKLRKAKTVCFISKQTNALSHTLLVIRDLFMECLHLISDYHKRVSFLNAHLATLNI